MQKFDVAIIGGGASGLACAVGLKQYEPSISVVVIEAGERLGKKLAATGNGQGNLSNADMDARHFHGSGAPLAAKLCLSSEFNPLSLFDCLFSTDKLGRIYPAGKQASALSDCLIRKINKAGVNVISSTKVTAVNKGFTLTLSDGGKVAADYVVLAAGGKAQKQFNTDGDGYVLAESTGHKITPLSPSLVQLKCDTRYIKNLKGIRAECGVSVTDKSGKLLVKTEGDVIFTDYGVSGNAVFYASAYCAGTEGNTLSLEFLPGVPQAEIERDVLRKAEQGYPEGELLAGTLHNQLGRAVIRRCGSADAGKIAALVKNFTLKIEGSLGFDYAQVTKGGVEASQVKDTLESRILPRLYIVGETLDVDGDCGGYNLSWAFASGMRAAKSIAQEFGEENDD